MTCPSGYRLGLRGRTLLDVTRPAGDRGADVAQRTVAADGRLDVEVVDRGGREGEPLERVALPRIVTGAGAALDRGDGVDQDQDHPDEEDQHPDRGEQVVE